MKAKNTIILIIFIALLVVALIGMGSNGSTSFLFPNQDSKNTTAANVRFVDSIVAADGVVTAQNQATLHFQIGGKLVYLPFKKGDAVAYGATIASLDTYTIQRQLQAALNTYRATRDSFDQTKDNSNNNYLQAQQGNPYPLNYFSAAGIGGNDKTNAVNDMVKRIIDQNQANLDNSVINVELANYAYQLSAITSPLNGIVINEDITVPGQNITPATTFTVADPATMVFRANVTMSNINYINVGSKAEIAIDGQQSKITGTVVNIYPSKVILSNGQSVYQVDIQSDQLKSIAKLDQTGRVLIKTNSENVALAPAWTVLGGKFIWIDNNGTPELKTVTAGKIHGQDIEIINGLSPNDKIIISPKFLQSLKYKIL